MPEEKNNSKREWGWLSDRGHEKLDPVLDAYFDIKQEENDAKSADDPTKLRRILRHQLASCLESDTGLHRVTIGKIISTEKKGRLKIDSIERFFEELYIFFDSPVREHRIDQDDLILDHNTDIEWDEFIEGTVDRAPQILSQDWQALFELLKDIGLADTIAACRHAFCAVMGLSIYDHRPKLNQLKTLADVKNILSEIDESKVAVEFASAIIKGCQTESVRENIAVWRDRLAQQYSITVKKPEKVDSQKFISAYLLIILKPSGYEDLWLEVRLRLEEQGKKPDIIPIDIENEDVNSETHKWIRCSIDQVPVYLPEFLSVANEYLTYIQNEKDYKKIISLTLEVFLPFDHIDYHVDEWKLKKPDGRIIILGRKYAVAVRPLDRFTSKDKEPLLQLGNRWCLLKKAIENSTVLEYFYPPENSEFNSDLDYEDLDLELEERVGLKWPSQLPEDEDDRFNLFMCILESGLPVTMWLYAPKVTPQETLKAFDSLLKAVKDVSDLYYLGQQIKRVRRKDKHPLQHISLLWDCPERTPLMPSTQDPLKIKMQ